MVVDFIAEFTNVEGQGTEEVPQWSIHTDGSSNKQAGGSGVILHSPEGDRIECMICLDFPTTNNEVEYETLITVLDLARAVGAENLTLYCASQVVTNQVNGDYKCKNEQMKKYLEHVKDRVNNLRVKFVQILREENEHADRLVKATSAEHLVILGYNTSVQEIGSEKIRRHQHHLSKGWHTTRRQGGCKEVKGSNSTLHSD